MLQVLAQRFSFSDKNWISFLIGAAVGIIPASKGLPSIFILIISLLYMWNQKNKISITYPIPVLQYVVIQFLFISIHSGVFVELDLQNYYILMFFSVPVIYFFLRDYDVSTENALCGVILGLLISAALVILDYYTSWNESYCRAAAFQYNVLRGAIQFVALASLCVAILTQRGRFGWAAAALLCLMFILSGPFMGARMSFYSVFFVFFSLGLFFIFKKYYLSTVKLVLVFVVSLSLAFIIDTSTNCGFMNRLSDLKLFVSELVPEYHLSESKIPPLNSNETNSSHPVGVVEVIANPEGASDAASAIRVVLWRGAFDSILENPWFGVGAANEAAVVNVYNAGEIQPNSHNQYLSWAISGGIFGLLSASLFFSTLFLMTKDRYLAFMFMISWLGASTTLSSLALGGTFAEFLVTLIVVMHIIGVKEGRWLLVVRPRPFRKAHRFNVCFFAKFMATPNWVH